ncbi:MAG TPA: succinate dehydrogenase, cytochrome b556 subunit [Alphaproteobacteria bacterium]|jgi:succinate dehydrogenase / fumarate reductase cytochrome b subunit|nr:succinate dehydrogenase, cytochrome b556 subunit [Alphaproteobacteria bacterium]
MVERNRPLSPHIQIYRPQMTSVLSILHRITGVGLGVGALLVAYWVAAAAGGPDHFARAQALIGSWFGYLVLLGFSVALFFHLSNGIRHLFWDAGYGFELRSAYASGVAVLVMTAGLTLIAWVAAFTVLGGAR